MNKCPPLSDAELKGAIWHAPQLSQATKSTYLHAVQRAQQVLGGRPLRDILQRPMQSCATLERAFDGQSTTLAATLAGLLALMKHAGLREAHGEPGHAPALTLMYSRWLACYIPVAEAVRQRREAGAMTARQRAGAVTWAQVVAKNEMLWAAAPGSDDSLLSGFYADLEPRRQQDYSRVFIVREGTDSERARAAREPAVVDLTASPPTVTVREYKTARHHGEWSRALPERLATGLRLSLLRRPRDYVFTSADGAPLSVQAFTKRHNRRLREWFGPAVTNNSLRHARATAALLQPLSLAARRELARDMGHSVEMGLAYAFLPTS